MGIIATIIIRFLFLQKQKTTKQNKTKGTINKILENEKSSHLRGKIILTVLALSMLLVIKLKIGPSKQIIAIKQIATKFKNTNTKRIMFRTKLFITFLFIKLLLQKF
jgi:hypothetical protein